MQVIKSEMLWFFDVDGTLISYDPSSDFKLYDIVTNIKSIRYMPNDNNIRLLMEKKSRGCTIVVWSQGGFDHAVNVVRALNLEQYVDYCMTKPAGIVDDLEPSEWLPRRVFIPIDVNYKKG